MPSWSRMDGRATPTIDTSRPSRNNTPQSRINAAHRCADQRGEAVDTVVDNPVDSSVEEAVDGAGVDVVDTPANLHAMESNARGFNDVATGVAACASMRH